MSEAPRLAWRPRIGITWGSNARPDAMRKLGLYVTCVRTAGGEPVAVLPLAAVGDAVAYVTRHDSGLFQLHAGEGAAARDFDGLVFAGGRDVDPRHYGQAPSTDTLDVDGPRDLVELPLLRAALAAGVPVFGICRGLQLLNVALGGTLVQDIPSQWPGAAEHRQGAAHAVRFVPGSRLALLAGRPDATLNSWHHQGITSSPAPGLVATALAPDGVIEGLEPEPGRFQGYVLAVQWHPERPGADDSAESRALTQALFEDFLAACVERAALAAPPSA